MDILMVDNICRICLQRQDTLFSLFRKIKGSSPYEKLVNKTQLKIEVNDAGPSSICSQCLIELDTTVNFLEKCEQSNLLLSQVNLEEGDSKADANHDVGSDRKGEEETVCVCLESNSSQSLLVACVQPEISDKAVESIEDEVEEPVVTQTPVVLEPARCPDCGSLRRCRHWAPPTSYTCQYCQKVFNRKFNFKLHLKRHLGERDWPCPSCGLRLLTRGLAQRHCEPRRRRACPAPGCGKTFTTNTNLTTHMRVHSGERPHVCVECGKTFTSKNSLNAHFRIHTGAKPYICPVCGRQFTTNKLAAHLRTHSGARTHVCGAAACRRAFPSPRALRLHAATHAPPARAHACRLCPAAYQHRQSLRKHTRRAHRQDPQLQV